VKSLLVGGFFAAAFFCCCSAIVASFAAFVSLMTLIVLHPIFFTILYCVFWTAWILGVNAYYRTRVTLAVQLKESIDQDRKDLDALFITQPKTDAVNQSINTRTVSLKNTQTRLEAVLKTYPSEWTRFLIKVAPPLFCAHSVVTTATALCFVGFHVVSKIFFKILALFVDSESIKIVALEGRNFHSIGSQDTVKEAARILAENAEKSAQIARQNESWQLKMRDAVRADENKDVTPTRLI